MDINTIGNAASGADYAADIDAINLWEAGQDGVADDQTGELITDVTGNYVTFSGIGVYDWYLKSDSTRRTYFSDDNNRMIRISDADPTFYFEDFNMDFNGYGSSYSTIQCSQSGGVVVHCSRVGFTGNTAGAGVKTGGSGSTWTFSSCISWDNSGDGFAVTTGTSIPVVFKNCGAFQNGDDGFDSSDDYDCYCWNCVAMGNTNSDFDSGHPHLGDYNISSDDKADQFTNYLINKTDYTTYFTNWASFDFHLKSDDPWGAIGYNAGNQAPDDFDGVAWTNNNLGPYEYTTPAAGVSKDHVIGDGVRSGIGIGVG